MFALARCTVRAVPRRRGTESRRQLQAARGLMIGNPALLAPGFAMFVSPAVATQKCAGRGTRISITFLNGVTVVPPQLGPQVPWTMFAHGVVSLQKANGLWSERCGIVGEGCFFTRGRGTGA